MQLFTFALRGLLSSLKPGSYHPRYIASLLGLSPDDWKRMSKLYLYPEGSLGRTILQEIGVSVETKVNPEGLRISRLAKR
ncbi:hypothetical protein [Wenxinia marina]|uniref:Uncharacterized protein n=1 Tax=Wenxinia marina DSM 24838 TaxID=1123501 RepID=A0A0D0PHW8_9RHOB|nr:hypothetical protein [Wenxinia marina]KIQ70981.1 hypothetical protein Wenmar_00358 [Wenxinia marina DSM 24838]GGL55780.1 hypothetical protein GCM10011392_07770 [Wenxinia marina]